MGPPATDAATLARFLVELRSAGIGDPALLTAFERVPRAMFFPDMRAGLLYAPIALPLPCGEEAAPPLRVARLLHHLRLSPGLGVLEIGTGSGYPAALMASLGCSVLSLERTATLRRRAENALTLLGLETKVEIRQADGLAPLRPRDDRRFERIVLHGASGSLPNHLFDRLAPGGFLVAYRRKLGVTRLERWSRDASGQNSFEDLGEAPAPGLIEGLPAVL